MFLLSVCHPHMRDDLIGEEVFFVSFLQASYRSKMPLRMQIFINNAGGMVVSQIIFVNLQSDKET